METGSGRGVALPELKQPEPERLGGTISDTEASRGPQSQMYPSFPGVAIRFEMTPKLVENAIVEVRPFDFVFLEEGGDGVEVYCRGTTASGLVWRYRTYL